MRRYVAAIALAFAAYALPMQATSADTPATVESCTTDAECVTLECGPGEWSIGDALAGEGCVSLTENGEGRLPDCTTPEKVKGNGWCQTPEMHSRAAELIASMQAAGTLPMPCQEDEPCWDCRVHGNRICGTDPQPAPVLPRTL